MICEWNELIPLTEGRLRKGQLLFSIVDYWYPELGNEARGKDFDCFYNDENIDSFLSWLSSKVC